MITPTPTNRVVLDVPFHQMGDARRSGAHWCPIEKQWWIGRNAIASHASIYRWIPPSNKLAAEAKAAHKFLKSEKRKGKRGYQ